MSPPAAPVDASLADAPLTHARVLRIALPIVLANLSVPLIGLADTAVVGQLGQAAPIGAVGLGAVILASVYWIFGFLRMGTTGLTSQAVGRESDGEVRNLLGQSLLLAGVIGTLLILFSQPLIALGLWLLDGSEAATALAAEYAAIRIFSAPAVLANYAILGWFLGQQNSRVTLAILVLTNSVNIVLDLLFVVGLGMTSDGVAWATVIADYTALAFGLWLVSRQLRLLDGRFLRSRLLALAAYRELFAVNANLFVRTLGLLFAMAFFTSRGAAQGDTVLAANAVLLQFILLTSYALDGFAHAAEAITGRAVGRRRWDEFGRAVKSAAWFSLATAGAAALSFALGGQWLIALLTGLPEVRATAGAYLPWMVAMPLIAVWSYLLDGVFIGATAIREMRNSIFIALAAYLPAWWLTQALLPEALTNHGLWFAFTLFAAVRSGVLTAYYLRYRRTRWRDSAARAD